MRGLADLLRPAQLDEADSAIPDLMVGEVVDVAPLRVKVPALDGGRDALRAFGTFPTAAAGDEVRVMRDEFGEIVIVAWEAS